VRLPLTLRDHPAHRLAAWQHRLERRWAGPGADRRAAQRSRPGAGRRGGDVAADTAAALAAVTGQTVRHDERLRERFFGAWQGLTTAEVAVQRPDEFARWKAGENVVGGDVETLDDLGKRVADGLQDAARLAPGGVVVAATHGAAARQGIGQLLGWPVAQVRTLRPLQNCHWVELTLSDGGDWQLAAYNVGVFAERPVPPPVWGNRDGSGNV
jgi:hypothetical protein